MWFMPYLVAQGAVLRCSHGLAPTMLQLTPRAYAADNLLLATIMDFQPMTNIGPFGVCNSMSNPQVQAATAAAQGVLTPMPCMPQTMPWSPGSAYISQDQGGASLPVLTSDSTCQCGFGGQISVEHPACVVKVD
jgi:Domain of unknown function (DUF4280)